MSISNILVPITGARHDVVALETAFAAARPFQAHIHALFVSPDESDTIHGAHWQASPDTIRTIAEAGGRLKEQLNTIARRTFAACVSHARARVASLAQKSVGVTASWSEDTGQLSQAIAAHAHFADLVVFPPPSGTQDGEIHEAYLHTLLRVERPVLLSPHSVPQHVGAKVAVGWDDGLAASHALLAAMPFLETSGTVRLLCVRKASSAELELTGVREYLSLHGVKATEEVITRTTRPIGATLLDAAVGCDLMVIGGYGHSHALESVFGGVSEHISSHPNIPILMVH